MQDGRCWFGLAARVEMIRRRQAGESLRAIAAAPATPRVMVRMRFMTTTIGAEPERCLGTP